MFHTSSVWFLLLLGLVPLLIWRLFRARRIAAVPFSSTRLFEHMPRTWRQRLRWLPSALLMTAVITMIVAMARPQEGKKQTITDSEGIAIELVVDRSGSMQAMDFDLEGTPVDRLTAIKHVARKFVLGDGDLEGRYADLIGLIQFAGYVDALNPPTLDHEYLVGMLDQVEIVRDRNEDGTAIGDAVGLAVEKLTDLAESAKQKNETAKGPAKTDSGIKSKVIILLTDGENNAGELDPLPAAELAKTLGIKIYTIGVGTRGRAPVPVTDPYTGRTMLQMMEVNIDEDTLKKMAEVTGGKYFRATDTQSLEQIYREIDELEKSYVEARHFVEYRELAVEPYYVGGLTIPPLVVIALVLLAAQQVLTHTWMRELNG